MSAPTVTAVAVGSPAEAAQIEVGDQIVSLAGRVPRDVIDFHHLADAGEVEIVLARPSVAEEGGTHTVVVHKDPGVPLGIEISSAVFDRIRTCDNHCAFCFIYQLPKGMRRSLYVKDDDYRLSFLYGNFTTLTRFTELDAERVLEERLGPLFVSIHATNPEVRAQMLRNPRGATSLRWLGVLLEGGIEVHGQVVVCPGVNDGEVLEETLADVADRYGRLASLGVVPLGVSRYSTEPEMRPHTPAEARAVVETVARWQSTFTSLLGRRMVHAADEYYLMAGRPFPGPARYEGFPQLENGIGMASSFQAAFAGGALPGGGTRHGFFAAVDGAPAEGYRAPRLVGPPGPARPAGLPVTVVTGTYGARILAPLLAPWRGDGVRLLAVENDYFGGNIAVAGLLTGADLARALAREPAGRRYLIPDSCLNRGRFLDGLGLDDLPHPVDVVGADGASLRAALAPLGVPVAIAAAR